jgi:hypothetical protein
LALLFADGWSFFGGMKALLAVFAGFSFLVVPATMQAQYKAPSQYFRKDSPGVGRNAPGAPGNPGTPAPAAPAVPAVPKFKELPVNTTFYFLSDTNRSYAWTKATDSTAKNTKNGITQTIHAETPVQR